ncbi:bifunctional UDP-3-O-[3-hydroxymyristoyl] N-acetylglucosamine deacetylase/3-hydroxyacyl-ACP dehydratase [Nibricoccus sp. IMCC34717]|uniref:bifunctional UDP-3-O-[3-hydroxymyristoyl] N-acetylglucosamine deacetylase/3-hydroxyacyl-ACP dehydratase n=1 Tax=Nibricoccus sp. IMCC34717 TaxID=3034021 RepID=UPI0038502862
MKQRTIAREVTIQGNALHTGEPVTLTLKPAPVDQGVVFRRVDLNGSPEIRPRVDQVTDLVRATTIQSGHAKIHTVEHVLSALSGCGIDNVTIEMNASEPPILDGSAKPFVDLIMSGDPVEQEKDREYFVLEEAVSVQRGSSSIIAIPYDGLKISCTSSDDRGIHTQHLSLVIDPDVYMTQVAASRTFTVYEDIEELIKLGKIKGGSLDCAVVIKGDKILSKEGLRFKDEFVRHKILDIIGDIVLLGVPLRAHIIATRPGHAINAELTKALAAKFEEKKKGPKKKPRPAMVMPTETSLDIRRVLDTLPHRYPFVMIDRVVEFIGNDSLIAIKNVAFNEPWFQGHFPTNPVMPGVLQLESMAQAAGILMLKRGSSEGKTSLFMSADKVKFRKPVRPGDQLIINAKLTKTRGNKLATAEVTCTVDGQVVSSGELMFAILDESEVD